MSTPFVTRAEWGARPRKAVPSSINSEGQTAHYGGGSPWGDSADRSSPAAFRDSTDHNRCASILRAWQSFHMDGRGWNDLAYNSVVCPHGHRYEGRGPGLKSGANGTNSGNLRSTATCYIAGGDDPITDEAKQAYLDECDRMGSPATWQHGDWKNTACAGQSIRDWKDAGWAAPSGGTIPTEPPPVVEPATAPAFPLPAGWYFGPKSGPKESVSGYYSHRSSLRDWQVQMQARGWRITADGLYGDETARVARAFQVNKGLSVDGLVGRNTWTTAWTAPVT